MSTLPLADVTTISHQLVSSSFPAAVFRVVTNCFSAMVSHVVSGRFMSYAFVLVPLTWFPSTHAKFQINLTHLGPRALAHLIPASGRVVPTSFLLILSQQLGSDMLISVVVQAPGPCRLAGDRFKQDGSGRSI